MPRPFGRRSCFLAVLAVLLFAAGCNNVTYGPSQTPNAVGSALCDTAGQPACVHLTVGLGYIPSVQFAPFYVAQQSSYYTEEGLIVEFQNKIDPDLVTLVGQGSIDLGVADGTSVIPAVSQGIPIRYIATIYRTYPSIVFAKASSGIATAADLRGKRIGIPGKYGSSWIMLQALLESAGLTPDDVTIVEYPDFGQGIAVQQGAVDAATGFANNEPVQLELTGVKAVVLHVDDVVALPGPGLIASTSTIDARHDAIEGFIAATLRAMQEITAKPSSGLAAAFNAVPELASDQETQAAILNATIATWTRPGDAPSSLGAIDRPGWQTSLDYLATLRLVPKPVTVDDLVREDLLPAS